MRLFDIISCKVILVLAGLVIVMAEVCLLVYGLLTGAEAIWMSVRALVLVSGLLVIVLALASRR